MEGEYRLKSAEGAAHSNGSVYDIDISTNRQRNARTDVLLVDYDIPDTVAGRRKRAFFIERMMNVDGVMTGLSDDRIVMTAWE
jgi:hypothetical protein